jgi:hypothetical protein
MSAYEDMIRATSRPQAPWFVVPADHKWFARLVVANALVDALQRLDLQYPEPSAAERKDMKKVGKALQRKVRRKGR